MMKIMLVWPWPVLGPTIMNRFGKSGIVVPLYAVMPVSRHWSASVRPDRPVTCSVIGSSVVQKPVATTSTSISRSTPSAVTIALPVTLAIGSVTSSTLSAASAGYQSLDRRIRLQPIMKCGFTRARSSGSLMPRLMLIGGGLRGRGGELGRQRERRHVGLVAPVEPGAVEPPQSGHPAQRRPLELAVDAVVARDDPRRGALVDVEVATGSRQGLLELGDDLDRRSAGADHRHPLAGQVDVVVPARRVEDLALEGVDAFDVGQPRLGQAAGADDQGLRDPGAVRRTHGPALGVVVPRRVLGGRVEDEAVERSRLRGDLLDVVLDLRLRGVGARPVVGRERVGVELARDVAGRARVGVVAPGATHVRALLQDHEVGLAVLLELDRGAQAGEAGADDQMVHVQVLDRWASSCPDGIGVIEQVSIEWVA